MSATTTRWFGPIESYTAEPSDFEPFEHPGGPAPALGGYLPVKGDDGEWRAHTAETPLRYVEGQWWVGAPAERATQRAVVLLREADRQGVALTGNFNPAEQLVARLGGHEQSPRYGYYLSLQIRFVEAALLIGDERARLLVEQVLASDPWQPVDVSTSSDAEDTLVAAVHEMHRAGGYHSERAHIAAALAAVESYLAGGS